MRAGYNFVAVLVAITLLVVGVILFSGCDQSETEATEAIDSLMHCNIYLENGYVHCDFESNTIKYYVHNPRFETEYTIPQDAADDYRQFMTELCNEMLSTRNEYGVHYEDGAVYSEYRKLWSIYMTDDTGREEKIMISELAGRKYPDCWDEFIQRTSDIIGRDISEIVEAPEVYIPEISELVLFGIRDGNYKIIFDYKKNIVEYVNYSTQESTPIEVAPEKMAETYEFMRDFCENMFRQFCQDTLIPEDENAWRMQVIYTHDDPEHYITSFFYIDENAVDWGEFVSIANELFGFERLSYNCS